MTDHFVLKLKHRQREAKELKRSERNGIKYGDSKLI